MSFNLSISGLQLTNGLESFSPQCTLSLLNKDGIHTNLHATVIQSNRPLVMLMHFLLIHIDGPLVSIVCIGPLVKLIGSCRSLIVLMDFNLLIHLNWHYNPLTLMTPGPGCNAGWTPWRWY